MKNKILFSDKITAIELNKRFDNINDLFFNIIKSVLNKNTKNLNRFNMNNISFEVLKDIANFLLNVKNDLYILKVNDNLINKLNIKYVYYHNDNNINIEYKTKGTKNYILIYYSTFDNNHVYIISDNNLIKRFIKLSKDRKLIYKLSNYHKRLFKLNQHDVDNMYNNINDLYNYNDNINDIKLSFKDLKTFKNYKDYKICLLSYKNKYIKTLKEYNNIKGYYDIDNNTKKYYSKSKVNINKYDLIIKDIIYHDVNTIKDIIYHDYNNYYDLINILDSLYHLNFYHEYLIKSLNDLINYVNDLILDIKVYSDNLYQTEDNFNDYDNYHYNTKDYFLYHKNTYDKI